LFFPLSNLHAGYPKFSPADFNQLSKQILYETYKKIVTLWMKYIKWGMKCKKNTMKVLSKNLFIQNKNFRERIPSGSFY